MRRFAAVLLIGLASVVAAQTSADAPDRIEAVIGEPAGPPRAGAELEVELERTASLLRCPVCQGMSINDSPAEMAVNMKAQAREILARGYSGEQTIEYFERSYGEFVRLEPKREGLNWIVWIAPFAALAVGAALIVTALKRSVRRREAANAAVAPELPPIPPDLEPWVEKVRILAYGPERDS